MVFVTGKHIITEWVSNVEVLCLLLCSIRTYNVAHHQIQYECVWKTSINWWHVLRLQKEKNVVYTKLYKFFAAKISMKTAQRNSKNEVKWVCRWPSSMKCTSLLHTWTEHSLWSICNVHLPITVSNEISQLASLSEGVYTPKVLRTIFVLQSLINYNTKIIQSKNSHFEIHLSVLRLPV